MIKIQCKETKSPNKAQQIKKKADKNNHSCTENKNRAHKDRFKEGVFCFPVFQIWE